MKEKTIKYWLIRCEALIASETTSPRTRGKYKAHGSTNSLAWVIKLSKEVQQEIRRTHKGIGYDENMALASRLGRILVVWYTLVRRAKSYDENRPAAIRRKVNKQVTNYRGQLCADMSDDALMGYVWKHQKFRPPFGKEVKSGKFV